MSVVLLILGLVLFVGLVVVHEFGHYLAARRGGVDVEEFGIGFPPRVWSKKLKNGVLFTLNLTPLGGFVRLKGENDDDTAKGSYGAARLSTKVKIMTAGVAMNLAIAFLLLTVLAWVGMPKLIENQYTVASDTKTSRNAVLIGYIESGSPADKAGLKVRDQIISLKSKDKDLAITSAEDLPKATSEMAGQQVVVKVQRQGQSLDLPVGLRTADEAAASKKTDKPKGYLGLQPAEYTLRQSTWSAPVVAGGLIGQFTSATLKGLGHLVAGIFKGHGSEATSQVAGPVGIFMIIKEGSLLGYQSVLMIIAIISLTLAIMNVLPIPALDGGRLFVTLLFRALGKKLTKETENTIHGAGFLLLMLLFAVITVVDIKRFL